MVCIVKEGNRAIVRFRYGLRFLYVAFLFQIALSKFYFDFADVSALN